MKIKLLAIFVILIVFILFILPRNLFADSGVTVKGRVFYYCLENTGLVLNTSDCYDDVSGGEYLPARSLYIEIEFDSPRVADVKTRTDEDGYFEIFVNKNPWWGTWDVDIEVMSWVMLDYNNADPIMVSCFEDSEDIFQYNGQTGVRAVGKNQTLAFDVYIGGPQNNIDDWWDMDITGLWDGGAGDGKNHISSFFMVDVLKDGFDWLTERDVEPSEIYRTTCIIYPSDETGVFGFFENNIDKYKGMQPPPGTGHIHIIPKNLWPNDRDDIISMIDPLGNSWSFLRGTILHEFSHKIMHDVYWTFPVRADFWKADESHWITACLDAELGWKEGWAEFLSAAIRGQCTVNGNAGMEEYNIEFSYHPDAFPDLYYIDPPELGNIQWHYTVMGTDSFDLIRDYNEGENAAVLWDIFDDKGWEYLPQIEQDMKPEEWGRELMWYDSLEDNNLSKIWSIVKDHAPDCLMDEADGSHPFKIEDSFWYYWLEKYSENTENIHALKAILFNRGISSMKKPESSPSIVTKSLDAAKHKLNVEIKEFNPEDQPYLYYNIAYRARGSDETQYMFEKDQLLSSVSGPWTDNRCTVILDIPPKNSWENLWLMVHDSMMPIFSEYVNEIAEDEYQGSQDDTETQKEKFILEEVSVIGVGNAFDIVVDGKYAYIDDWEDGLVIADISDPENPQIITVYDRLTEKKGKWYSPKALALKDNYIYLATHIGEFVVIDVSDPANPKQAGFIEGKECHEGICISGNYAYIAAKKDGLLIFDISDPKNPKKISVTDTPDYAFEVEVSGNIAYIAGGGAICAVDVSDPKNPILLGSSPIYLSKGVSPGSSGYVYASNFKGVLQVIDFNDTASPQIVNSIQMIKSGFNLFIKYGCLFAANGSRGMSVYDISDPASPEEIFVFNPEKTRGQSRNVYVDGNYVYLTANNGGVIIFKMIDVN